MNNKVILSALQAQLVANQAAYEAHYTNVFTPAVDKLNAAVAEWFSQNVMPNIHSVSIERDSLTILPNNENSWHNDIKIERRGGWAKQDAYYEMSMNRQDVSSKQDNENSLHYFNCVAAVTFNFSDICKKMEGWLAARNVLSDDLSAVEENAYTCKREIRRVEDLLKEEAKEAYFQTGFECQLLDTTEFNYDDKSMRKEKHYLHLQYGRARWDYYRVNSFKVVNYPKTKHGKVVLEFSYNGDTATREINKPRYAEFVDSVYNWQTSGAASQEEYIKERVARYASIEA